MITLCVVQDTVSQVAALLVDALEDPKLKGALGTIHTIHIHTHIYTYTHAYVYTHPYVYTHACIYIHIHSRTHVHIHTRIYTHAHTHVYMCVNTCVFYHSRIDMYIMHGQACTSAHYCFYSFTHLCALSKTSCYRSLCVCSTYPYVLYVYVTRTVHKDVPAT